VLGNTYTGQTCSIAAALDVVGERWTILIVRDILLGLRRFDEIQEDLGVARNVLQSRLKRLVEHGIVERRPYQERPARYEYLLTDAGLDLWPTIVSLIKWGDRHAGSPAGPPVVIVHRGCGGEIDDHRICEACGARVSVREARALPGPGAGPGHPLVRRPGGGIAA